MATVLVIDGGGRGSVLVDKYLQSRQVSKVLATPGNDLMLQGTKKSVEIFPDIKTTDIKGIIKVCQDYSVDLIEVAQDDAVAVGVTDALVKKGFQVFGPTKSAGQIEWDKAWSRNFMKKNGISSPSFKIFDSEIQGINFIKSQKNKEWFIKASGLAAGKGALYAKDNKDAISKIRQMKNFSKAGKTFLIEECLYGEEFSSFAIVDGKNFKVVGHAQDHKTVFDADKGPNTGGMGCSSPPLVITEKIESQINSVFKKTTKGLVKAKRPYRGILYLGGIINKSGKVYVIEFNARWGDPEAEVIIPSIKNDFYEMAKLIIGDKINKVKLVKDNLYRIVVAAAAKGYPQDYSKVVGKQIVGLDSILKKRTNSYKVFGAGTKYQKGKYWVAGGRLFYMMASGKNVRDARKKAYNALSKIKIEGNSLHYRKDIGYRDLERLSR